MIYVSSDLHGCIDKYEKLLERIKLTDKDTLYLLGDYVDRGPSGLNILLGISENNNIVALRGNHDDTAYRFLKAINEKSPLLKTEKFVEAMSLWLDDGGDTTFEEFKKLEQAERDKVLAILQQLPLFEEINIAGKDFFLSHTVSDKKTFLDENRWKLDDFIWGEPEYEKCYKKDLTIVTGHTPTSFIDERYAGKIYKANNHIAVDCGAVYGNRLGCICLDTMEEIYI